MGRFDYFVLRDAERVVLAEFKPEEVTRGADGSWRVTVDTAIDKLERGRRWPEDFNLLRPRLRPMDVVRLVLHACAMRRTIGRSAVGVLFDERVLGDYSRGWVVVEPHRPPCRHYIRQRSQFSLNPQHKDYYRLCALRRTTEGAMMSVKDWGMWACDGRDPRDLETEKQIDDFDEMKEEQGTEREYINIFNVSPEELVEVKRDGPLDLFREDPPDEQQGEQT